MVRVSMRFLPDSQPKRIAPKPLVDPASKTILFWMHRCGSTTAQLWFFQTCGWDKRMKGMGASALSPLWYEEHAKAYEDLPSLYRDPSYMKIAVVRNPLSRAVSAYTVVTDTKSGSQWRAVQRSLPEPDDARRLTFHEFLDFLERTDLAAANYHWRLQTASDWHDLSVADVQFARVEHLQRDLDALCKRLGKRPAAMRMNSAQTKVEGRGDGRDVTRMTRAEFHEAYGVDKRGVIRFPDYTRFLNEETIARIARLYARDFAVLGYKAEVGDC
jgi:sulfotransferase famil protein